MSRVVHANSETPQAAALPTVAWVLAGLFLVGQAAQLMTRGVATFDTPLVPASMVLTALVVRWFADGVLRARAVRLAIVWILLSATVSLGFVGIVAGGGETTAADVVALVFAAAQLVALGIFATTGYFARRRAAPEVARPALAPLLMIAIVTGLLGGLTAPTVDSGASMSLNIGL